MKRKIVIGLLLPLTIVLSGCKKDAISNNLIGYWNVVKLRINGDPCAYYDFKSPSLEFYDMGALQHSDIILSTSVNKIPILAP